MSKNNERAQAAKLQALLRNFLIELILYSALVIGYFVVVLQLFSEYLTRLFHNNLVLYAFVALFLIVAQGVLLDWLTSFLVDKVKLARMKK